MTTRRIAADGLSPTATGDPVIPGVSLAYVAVRDGCRRPDLGEPTDGEPSVGEGKPGRPRRSLVRPGCASVRGLSQTVTFGQNRQRDKRPEWLLRAQQGPT